MSKAKHTPGPWIVHRGRRRQNDRDYMAVIDSIPDRDGQVVANCICHVAATNPNRIANADMIAAGKRQPTLAVVHRLADVAGRRLALGRGRRAKAE